MRPTFCETPTRRCTWRREAAGGRPSACALGAVEPRKDLRQNVVDGDIDLLTGRQVLDPDGARLDVAVPGDQGDRRTGAVGGPHRTLDPTVAVREVDAHTRGTQPGPEHRKRDLGLLTEWHGEHVDTGRTADGFALGLQRQHRPVDTEIKSDAGQVLSAELAHQTVIPA